MFLMFSTSDRCTVSALLLAVGKTKMRLAVPGQPDALELRLLDGWWTREGGDRVTIVSMIQSGECDLEGLGMVDFPRVSAARAS